MRAGDEEIDLAVLDVGLQDSCELAGPVVAHILVGYVHEKGLQTAERRVDMECFDQSGAFALGILQSFAACEVDEADLAWLVPVIGTQIDGD